VPASGGDSACCTEELHTPSWGRATCSALLSGTSPSSRPSSMPGSTPDSTSGVTAPAMPEGGAVAGILRVFGAEAPHVLGDDLVEGERAKPAPLAVAVDLRRQARLVELLEGQAAELQPLEGLLPSAPVLCALLRALLLALAPHPFGQPRRRRVWWTLRRLRRGVGGFDLGDAIRVDSRTRLAIGALIRVEQHATRH